MSYRRCFSAASMSVGSSISAIEYAGISSIEKKKGRSSSSGTTYLRLCRTCSVAVEQLVQLFGLFVGLRRGLRPAVLAPLEERWDERQQDDHRDDRIQVLV